MDLSNNGVTYPKGFKASGVSCGIKKNQKKDLAIVSSEDIAVSAGVFTKNIVKGHSIKLSMEHIKNPYAKAIVINSGNANACLGEQGYKDALDIAELASSLLDCTSQNILLGSTGVIGVPLNMPLIRGGIRNAVATLSSEGGHDASEAILTTDTSTKEAALEIEIQGEKVRIGAMAKGSGMVHPNMATMIGVITTDINISHGLLNNALKEVVNKTFNRVSIDGETSICDMVLILANGEAENSGIIKEDAEYEIFVSALEQICTKLSKLIAKDGIGATKLLEITVDNAADKESAYKIASTIAKSPLFKVAMFGEEANWGAIITAVGYSGVNIDPNIVDIFIGDSYVVRNGATAKFDEVKVKNVLCGNEIKIRVSLKLGQASDRIWTCDFSENYIRINSGCK